MTPEEFEARLEDEEFRETFLEMQEEMGFTREETLAALEDDGFVEAAAEMFTDMELDLEDREHDWT